MKVFLFICLGCLILVLLIIAIYLIIGYSLYKSTLSKNSKMKRKIEENHKVYLKNMGIDETYFNNEFSKIYLQSFDNLKLCGFYKNKGYNKLAILIHGFGGCHLDMAEYSKLFDDKGYDILAIDLRSHGESEGDFVSLGEQEERDLQFWIEKMLEINQEYKIALFGISLGASTVCLAASNKNLSNKVVLAVEDCGFDSVDKEVSYQFGKRKFHFPVFLKIFYSYMKKTKKIDLKHNDISKALKNSKIPILFIHGDSDSFVPTEMVFNLYNSLPEHRRSVYISKGAGHIKSYRTNPSEYKAKLYGFLNEYNM